MDNGPIDEQPDVTTLKVCPPGTVITGNTNTWENVFFTSHFADEGHGGLGLSVEDWVITATSATWTTGGEVANKTWKETCPSETAPLSAVPIVACDGTTHMWLRLVAPPAGP